MACPGAGHGDAAGDGDVSVALSPAIGDGGVGAPSPAAPTVPFLPGTDDVEDARRRYADVVVEACRQRTLIEATLLDKKYRWPANRRLHGMAWRTKRHRTAHCHVSRHESHTCFSPNSSSIRTFPYRA